MHNTRIHGLRSLRLRATLLAWLPVVIAIVLIIFALFFAWFAPKVFRALRRILQAIRAIFSGESFRDVARKAG